MELQLVFFIGFAVIAVGVLLVKFYFSKEARTKRALSNTERQAIGDAPEGTRIKVAGTLRFSGDPIYAPLSGRPCAAWQVVIQEYRSHGKGGSYHTIVDDHQMVDFILEDGSGRAIVRASYGQLALAKDARFSSGTFDDAPPELERFLADRGKSSVGMLGFNKKMKYREGILEQGETVSVVGSGQWEPDPDPDAASRGGGYRSAAQRLLVTATAEGELLVSDDPSVAG